MRDTITHIAGPPITACGRLIQRCSLCGEKLVDSKNTASPDGRGPGTWQVGRLVQVTEGNPQRWTLLDDTEKLPDDSCLELVE